RRHTRWPRDWSSDVCSSDLLSGACSGFELRGGGKRVYETGASSGKIESPSFFRPEFCLHQTGARRKEHVGRDGRNNDQIQFGRRSEERRVGKACKEEIRREQ